MSESKRGMSRPAECFLCGEPNVEHRRCMDQTACDERCARLLGRALVGVYASDLALAARRRDGYKR